MVEFFKELPWYIKYPGQLVIASVGGYVNNHPEIFPSWAVLAGAAIAAWVALAFLWHVLNYWRALRQQPRIKLEPLHIIALGLTIALGGVIWQWQRPTPIDPKIAVLQSQIDSLKQQLSAAVKSELPSTYQTAEAAHSSLSPRDVKKILDALSEINKDGETKIWPAINEISSWAANWRGVLRNQNAVQLYTRYRDALKTDVWDTIDAFLSRHQQFNATLQSALALDYPAAQNELDKSLLDCITALGKLPPNSPPEMDDLVEPQFKELIKQSEIAYEWELEAKRRIAEMQNNLKTKGVAEYAKR